MSFPHPVAPAQRAYVASHSVDAGLTIGVALTGIINLLWPLDSSASASVLPPLVLLIFNLTWALGGTLSVAGLLRGRRRVESAGMVLLASGLLAYCLVILAAHLPAARSAGFILALSIGCSLRAWHLTAHGYVTLDVPVDQKGIK